MVQGLDADLGGSHALATDLVARDGTGRLHRIPTDGWRDRAGRDGACAVPRRTDLRSADRQPAASWRGERVRSARFDLGGRLSGVRPARNGRAMAPAIVRLRLDLVA